MRSKRLSSNKISNREVIIDAIKQLKLEVMPTYICQIFATAPFISHLDIIRSYKKLKYTKTDFCFSVSKFSYPIQRALKLTNKDRIEMFFPKYRKYHSQKLKKSYHDAGQFYWGDIDSWLKESMNFDQNSFAYKLPTWRVQDIDTLEDWSRAELIFNLI